jgi:hypothetical protein
MELCPRCKLGFNEEFFDLRGIILSFSSLDISSGFLDI